MARSFYLDKLKSVILKHFNILLLLASPVVPFCEQPPELSPLGGGDVVVDPLHLDDGLVDGALVRLVDHLAPDPQVGGLHELEERLLVQVPLLQEVLAPGIFAAAQLHRDLEAVGVDVVEVLHPTGNVVPGTGFWNIFF